MITDAGLVACNGIRWKSIWGGGGRQIWIDIQASPCNLTISQRSKFTYPAFNRPTHLRRSIVIWLFNDHIRFCFLEFTISTLSKLSKYNVATWHVHSKWYFPECRNSVNVFETVNNTLHQTPVCQIAVLHLLFIFYCHLEAKMQYIQYSSYILCTIQCFSFVCVISYSFSLFLFLNLMPHPLLFYFTSW